jgi:hypothetical protein
MRDDELAYAYKYSIGNNRYAGYSFRGDTVALEHEPTSDLFIHRTSLFPK